MANFLVTVRCCSETDEMGLMPPLTKYLSISARSRIGREDIPKQLLVPPGLQGHRNDIGAALKHDIEDQSCRHVSNEEKTNLLLTRRKRFASSLFGRETTLQLSSPVWQSDAKGLH